LRNAFEKVFMGAAGSAGGGGGLDVDEVFSTQLYSGSSANRNIVNGIDLDGEGGMIWTKVRTANFNHVITDTEQGLSPYLVTHATSKPDNGGSDTVTSFNSNGYSLGADGQWYWNKSGYNYASWTWRKAPKFFDVVTYTGSGSAKTVAHSLDSVPGMIIIKNISIAGDSWAVYHRANTAAPQTDYLVLNTTAATVDSAAWWNDTAPTSSVFTVGTDHAVNANNENYVAYVFAHNDSGDGEFGPDSDQDIIKCGSFTTNSAGIADVTLNFEPQWVMIKATTAAGPWRILDSMRGLTVDNNDVEVYANSASAEAAGGVLDPSSTGFSSTGIGGSTTYIYMAIRRGSLFPPEAATEVFDVKTKVAGPPAYVATMPQVDFALSRVAITSAGDTFASTRGAGFSMKINEEDAEPSSVVSGFELDHSFGIGDASSASSTTFSWMWKRAPGFFDTGFYKGNSTARTLPHQLGVVPEMFWVKCRSGATNWFAWHKDTANNAAHTINSNAGFLENNGYFNNTAPTSSVINIGNNGDVNYNNLTFVFYCFASLEGISKVGSYTGTGSSFNVDCGFTSGARWVMIKDSRGGPTFHFDTVRGITSGANDNRLTLDDTSAKFTSYDYINANSNGFNTGTISTINSNGVKYLFYAIA